MKLTLSAVLLCLLSLSAIAQQSKWRVGAAASLDAYSFLRSEETLFAFNDTGLRSFRFGFTAGGVVQRATALPFLSLESGLYYQRRVWEEQGSFQSFLPFSDGGSDLETVTIQYAGSSRWHALEIPIYARGHLGQWFAFAGPTFQWVFLGDNTTQQSLHPDSTIPTEPSLSFFVPLNIYYEVPPLVIDLGVGIGRQWEMNQGNALELRIQYRTALTNTDPNTIIVTDSSGTFEVNF